MRTRSITRIQQDGQTIVSVYRQYDGYLSGQGVDLANIMKDRKIVNGIRLDENKVFNGPNCLAACIIYGMKKEDNGNAGGVYVYGPDVDDEEYVYNVNVISKDKEGWSISYEDYPIITVIRYGEQIFQGTSVEFVDFVKKDEE